MSQPFVDNTAQGYNLISYMQVEKCLIGSRCYIIHLMVVHKSITNQYIKYIFF